MKKLLLLIALSFFSIFSTICLADQPNAANSSASANAPANTNDVMPVSKNMDENMRTMASAYLQKIGEELHLRSIDLYAMGEALVSHKNHPICQAKGQLAIQEAKKLYLISQEILKGNDLPASKMEKFVNDWK